MELTPSRWKGNTANESNNLRMNNPDLKRVVTYEKKKTYTEDLMFKSF